MRIAITQRQTVINDIVYDCLEQGWYRLFPGHEILVIPNLTFVEVDADLLVVSGGDQTEQRYRTELVVCEHAVKNHTPILGVCHGAFFLNYAFKGINAEIHGHHNTEHSIQMEGKTHTVNSFHNVCIYELGEELEPIAVTKDNQCEAFKHKELPIWGLVWHPERMEEPILPSDLRRLIYGQS